MTSKQRERGGHVTMALFVFVVIVATHVLVGAQAQDRIDREAAALWALTQTVPGTAHEQDGCVAYVLKGTPRDDPEVLAQWATCQQRLAYWRDVVAKGGMAPGLDLTHWGGSWREELDDDE